MAKQLFDATEKYWKDKEEDVMNRKETSQDNIADANLIFIKYYKDEQLLDYPKNNENISDTEDIEKSIEEQGFTDPLEITDYGMEDGNFMIVSGHRRRMAGRNKGMEEFPCILRHFCSDAEVHNYVLFSNAQRDSVKDPLLFAKRYRMHEEYLKEIGFKGSLREEIAKRLGLKPAQADRYNQFNKVILPIWDMVREGSVGMSSVTDSGLYTHSPQEQVEMLQMMRECMEAGNELTRPIIRKIVNSYREGKKSWDGISQDETSVADNVTQQNGKLGSSERGEEPHDFSRQKEMDDSRSLTEREKKLQAGNRIVKRVASLDEQLEGIYAFETSNEAEEAIRGMKNLVVKILAEIQEIGVEYKKTDKFKEAIHEISRELRYYSTNR